MALVGGVGLKNGRLTGVEMVSIDIQRGDIGWSLESSGETLCKAGNYGL